MADALNVNVGNRRGRHAIALPFTAETSEREVVLCANAKQAAAVAEAIAAATKAALVTATPDERLRGRDLLSGDRDADRLQTALRILGLEADLLDRRMRELRPAERFRVSLLVAHSAPLLVIDMTSVGGSVFEIADAFLRLRHLRAECGFATVTCISDPAYVATAGDRLTVLDAHTVVEHGPVAELVADPTTDYLRFRLAASPLSDPRLQQRRRMLGASGIPANDAPLPLDLAVRERRRRTEPIALQQLPLTNETLIIDL